MGRGINIVPRVPEDRSMTREEWKKVSSYCRVASRVIGPPAEEAARNAMCDLMLYGVTRPIEEYVREAMHG